MVNTLTNPRPVCDAMRGWLAGIEPVPPLNEFLSRFGQYHRGYSRCWKTQDWVMMLPLIHLLMEEREYFIEEFGFAVPTAETLDVIASYSPLVEIGAGTGAWAHLLAKRGADIIATDPAREKFLCRNGIGRWTHTFHAILPLGGEAAVRRWPERNVFAAWPSLNKPWLRQAARVMHPGRTLLVINESCCADARTWEYIETNFIEGNILELPNWHYMNDRLEVWRKKDENDRT